MERTIEALKKHYEIEKKLATKLRQSTSKERKTLYTSLYNELYKNVPILKLKNEGIDNDEYVKIQMNFLKRFISTDILFAEIGPGNCAFAFKISNYVKKVFAIDVSDEITKNKVYPDNFELIFSDGTSIPLPKNSINLIYSNQLMEHLHPDDAVKQVKNIKQALIKGGKYICITPNRINGPHDISKYFDREAKGFHLKEYSTTELYNLFKMIGFSHVFGYLRLKNFYFKTPLTPIFLIETLISLLPYSARKFRIFRPFLGLRIVAIK